jgi:hypothetical protein
MAAEDDGTMTTWITILQQCRRNPGYVIAV